MNWSMEYFPFLYGYITCTSGITVYRQPGVWAGASIMMKKQQQQGKNSGMFHNSWFYVNL